MIIIENILFMLFYICYFILYFEIFVYENHFHKIPGFQHFFFKIQAISRSISNFRSFPGPLDTLLLFAPVWELKMPKHFTFRKNIFGNT